MWILGRLQCSVVLLAELNGEAVVYYFNREQLRNNLVRVAVEITLDKEEQDKLEKIVRSSLSPVRLAQRAQIVLMASEGMRNQDIAKALGIGRVKVSRWRNRYAQSGLAGIERDLPRGTPPQKVDLKRLVDLTT
ncbi:helix-turn-helix domain-containing protein, partial [Thiolapillus sp.]